MDNQGWDNEAKKQGVGSPFQYQDATHNYYKLKKNFKNLFPIRSNSISL